ncbi:MAG: Holliday junction resolvase RuvX [Patescibacteria group bacterium]
MLIGIDFGESRTGIAITDRSEEIVFPRATMIRKSDEDLITKIKKLCDEEKVTGVVLGLPLDDDDNETDRSLRVRSFGKKLESSLSLPLMYQDEAYTTEEGRELLTAANKDLDSLAAMRILQRYLNRT